MNKKFIYALDDETSNALIQLGFRFIVKTNDTYVFENQPLFKFSVEEQEKLKFLVDDKLTF